MATNRVWLGWEQGGNDHRPITYPPPAPILGWWCSGEGHGYSTLCALVAADTEEQAWKEVRDKKAWPDAGKERFAELVGPDHLPGDRFPLNDWMKERLAAQGGGEKAS